MCVCVYIWHSKRVGTAVLWDWAFLNRRSWDSASSHWFMSLQCASPQAAAQQSRQSAALTGGAGRHLLAADLLSSPLLSSALPCTGADLEHHTRPLCSFGGQICFLCGSEEEEEEEETGVISVLLFGPQGEEPVVDSTLQREGAAQRGKIPFT